MKRISFTIYCLFFLIFNTANAQEMSFINVAPQLGIHHQFVHDTFWGAGVSFYDYDGDGLEDITLATRNGENIAVFRNLDKSSFINMTPALGFSDPHESKSPLWVDFDNDGDKDFFVANYWGSSRLYQNNDGQFLDITADAGMLRDSLTTTAACWADFDNDGWLDLYLTNHDPGIKNVFYRNRGDGTFQDVTDAAGLQEVNKNPLAVAALDYNGDGWQDIYVGSDRFFGNSLYRNNGDLTFTDVSEASNTDLVFHSMGIAVGDYDDDGDLDMYISNDPFGNGMLRNNGNGTFSEIASDLGVAVNKSCWGVNFLDYDNDSDLDLYVSVSRGAPNNENALFENIGNGRFAETSLQGLAGDTSVSYGNAIGDFNNDGYSDIAVLNEDSPFTLWQNQAGSNNWIKVSLTGTISNRDAVGSIIEIHRDGGKFIRSTHCGISYLSQNSGIETIGIGQSTIVDSIVVRWPSGGRDVLQNVAANEFIRITEGETLTGISAAANLPSRFELTQNYPNPFNPMTNIGFRISDFGFVVLDIFSISGQYVKTLLRENHSAGDYSVSWDGIDNNGRPVTSGIYVYRLTVRGKTGTHANSRKMILLR